MQIKRNNSLLRSVARNKFINMKLTEYNKKAGCWDEDTYEFNCSVLRKSRFYKKMFDNHEYDQYNLDDINIFKMRIFLKRFLSKIIMLIGFPVLYLFMHYVYIRELYRQKKYIKTEIEKIEYEEIYSNLRITSFGFIIRIIFGKISVLLNYFFGYVFERCWGIMIAILIKWLVLPIVILFQILELTILLSLLPLGLAFVTTKSIFSIFESNSNKVKKNKMLEIID